MTDVKGADAARAVRTVDNSGKKTKNNNTNYEDIIIKDSIFTISYSGNTTDSSGTATTDTADISISDQREQSTSSRNKTNSDSGTKKGTSSASVSNPAPQPDYTEMSKFYTDIPLFRDLSTKGFKVPDLKTETNADVHIKGPNKDAVRIEEQDDGSSKVYFEGSEMYAVIPPQHQPKKVQNKPVIVYDPKTNTMVFNNVEGLEIKLLDPEDSNYPNDAQKGTNIMVRGGSVKTLDTAEVGSDQKSLTQNIVLQNTKVENFDTLADSYITIGNTKILAADNHPEIERDGDNTTYWASDGKATVERADKGDKATNGNGQSGFTLMEGYRWLLGDGQDIKGTNVTEGRSNLGVHINDSKGKKLINVDFSNAPLCRELNGVDIYIQGGDARKIKNFNNEDTWFLDFNGTKVTFPSQTGDKKGKIYYDRTSQTLMFENIEGLEINYSEAEEQNNRTALLQGKGTEEGETIMTSSGANRRAKVVIKNCHCKNVNFMETCESNDGAKFKLKSPKRQDIIVIDQGSTVDHLYTNNDIVLMGNESKVNYYAGEKTQIGGVGNEELDDNNHIEEHKKQLRPKGNIDLTGTEEFRGVKFDNTLVTDVINGTNIYVQGDNSEIKMFSNDKGETVIEANGTKVTIPEQPQNEKAEPKFYYDSASGAIVLENINGATVVPRYANRPAQTKIYLKNSSCEKVDTQEHSTYVKEKNNGKEGHYVLKDSESAGNEKDIIYVDENSTVKDLRTNTDDVYIEDGATVEYYAGFHTNIQGTQDIEEINPFGDKFVKKSPKGEKILITDENNPLLDKFSKFAKIEVEQPDNKAKNKKRP